MMFNHVLQVHFQFVHLQPRKTSGEWKQDGTSIKSRLMQSFHDFINAKVVTLQPTASLQPKDIDQNVKHIGDCSRLNVN